MKLKAAIHAFSAATLFAATCVFPTGCKPEGDKPAGAGSSSSTPASSSSSSSGVTAKDVAANPGDVPQPASPPPPVAASKPTAAQDAAAVAGKREGSAGISWETPAGWSMGPAAPMRLATLTDGTAEIAISAFPGDVGGTLMNVNRWRQQLGLPPLASQADAEAAMATVDVDGGGKVRTLDLSNGGQRMLVAVAPGEGRLYFFKMTAPADVAAARKDAFDRFVKTIRVE
jgi:hypothetical protein